MKKIFIYLIGFVLGSFVFAGEVDHFVVEVKPNPTEANKANDLTIKAVDANGDIVTDYEGDVLISVKDEKGKDISDDSSKVTIPDDGVASFSADDEGVKTYSKGLIFKQAGTYTVEVSDLTNNDIAGSVKVQVNGEGSQKVKGNVQITSPINGSKEKKLPIDVIANSSLPNTVYQIFVDGQKIKEGLTDENGDINDTIDNLNPGDHTLQIKLLDVNNNEIGHSQQITFSYTSSENSEWFKSIKVLPSNTVNQGDTVKFIVNTTDDISSAQIEIKGIGEYPMDKVKDGQFKLEMSMDNPGTYEINVILEKNGNTKKYPKVAYVNVLEKVSIKNVKVNTNIQKASVDLTWQYTGKPSSFEVDWGTDKSNLSNKKVVKENKISLTGLDINKTYFVKIYPLDENGNYYGEPSSVIEVKFGVNHGAPTTCIVKNIKIRLKTINGKHYIVWDPVNGAEKYIVSSADKPDGNFTKLGETTDTKWEYPFDPKADKVIYKYYKVEAICKDGKKVQIDKVKKIKVGPADTIFVLIILSLILYSSYRLYLFTKQ